MLQIHRILVPTDFSKHARQALLHAREVAAEYRAQLDLLHVIEKPAFPAMYEAYMHELYGELPDVNEAALTALRDVLANTGGPDVETSVHVLNGHAAAEILQFADEHDVDMIVMASRGLTGLEHLMLGSVAEKVVRHAACPVLIVKAFGKSLVEPSPE